MISLMAAKLFEHGVKMNDFTGWGDPVMMGEVPTVLIGLSADGGPHAWSVIGERIGEKCRFTLVVQYSSGMGSHFKFPVHDVAVLGDEKRPRLVVTIYPGENIVLDCVDRPVWHPRTPEKPKDESEEEPDGESDESEGDPTDERPASWLERRRQTKKNTETARENMPPRSYTGFRRSR